MKIGVPYRFSKDNEGQYSRLYVSLQIKEMIEKFGHVLVPLMSDVGLKELIKDLDGLLLPGSYADVHPSYYHQEVLPNKNYEVDEYAYDKKVIEEFVKAQKPILGICGGLQELNVYFGGSLYQRIEGHCPGNHEIDIVRDSFLYEIYQSKSAEVNSFHFQAIQKVAPGFLVSAKAKDGTIEAIEKGNIIAVQYHPEIEKDDHFFECYFHKFYND